MSLLILKSKFIFHTLHTQLHFAKSLSAIGSAYTADLSKGENPARWLNADKPGFGANCGSQTLKVFTTSRHGHVTEIQQLYSPCIFRTCRLSARQDGPKRICSMSPAQPASARAREKDRVWLALSSRDRPISEEGSAKTAHEWSEQSQTLKRDNICWPSAIARIVCRMVIC